MKKNYYCSKLILAIVIALCFYSCKKSSDVSGKGDGSTAVVELRLNGSEFEEGANLGNRAIISDLHQAENPDIISETFDIGNDMLLIANLTKSSLLANQLDKTESSIKFQSIVAKEINPLGNGVRYRVVVFNSDGTFNRQQEYTRGSEESTTMLLEGGKTYTFVVYSRNSSTLVLPVATFDGAQTLANARVNMPGNADIMYFRQDLTLVGGAEPNRLNIILKHLDCQITTTIDATQTGYNISDFSASFSGHYSNSTIDLSTGAITRTGSVLPYIIQGPIDNPAPTHSFTSIINANAGTSTFNLQSLTVGSLTLTNTTSIGNLPITPGVKYDLLIRLVPTDEYLIHSGRPAARIDGIIWARHNLGVDPSVDPDAEPMTSTRHGDYHQWGRLTRSGSGTSTTANPFINNNEPANNTWNSGTETAPVKTPADPCPSGYRLPTMREYTQLINDTQQSNIGPFTSGNNRYDSAKKFTSRRNRSVHLTFPSQGRMNVTGGSAPPYANTGLINRGSTGEYISSYSTNNPRIRYMSFTSSGASMLDLGGNRASKSLSLTIRCVGIQ